MSSSTKPTQGGRSARANLQPHKKIAVLGCGKMGTILLESFLERKLVTPEEAIATVQHGDRSQELSRELSGVPVGTDNRAPSPERDCSAVREAPGAGPVAGRDRASARPKHAGDFHCRLDDDKFYSAKAGQRHSRRAGNAQHAGHGGRRDDGCLRRPRRNFPTC